MSAIEIETKVREHFGLQGTSGSTLQPEEETAKPKAKSAKAAEKAAEIAGITE